MENIEDEYYYAPYFTKKRTSKRKLMAPDGVHVPNKNEAKLLRNIMAKTGLSESEVRSHKLYRIQLSKAQKERGTKTRYERECLSILKSITKELKLPKEHPDVKTKYLDKIKKRGVHDAYFRFGWQSPLFVFNSN